MVLVALFHIFNHDQDPCCDDPAEDVNEGQCDVWFGAVEGRPEETKHGSDLDVENFDTGELLSQGIVMGQERYEPGFLRSIMSLRKPF